MGENKMNLLVVSDSHIIRDKTGKCWCNTAVHGYEFWKRYLQVFEEIHVVSRVQHVDVVDSNKCIRADGSGIIIVDLPFIRGFSGYLRNIIPFSKEVKKSIGNEAAAIFRVPSLPAYILLHYWKRKNKPYAFEVIVDPVDCYKTNKLAQVLFTHITRKECLKANGVSYVTQFFLESKYPSHSIKFGESDDYFDSYYSSINLEEDFFGEPRVYPEKMNRIKIVHVASAINSDVKGHTTLIKIVELLTQKGIDVSVRCLGAGDAVEGYQKSIKEKKLEEKIKFLGLLSSKEDIRNLLLDSDLFVLPTKAEGLPRAVIEAMAVGLPCLSTPVNGIPELLEEEYMFNPLDAEGFTGKIIELMDNGNEMTKMSSQNIKKAMAYSNEILTGRRNKFYQKLRHIAENKE